MNIDNIIKIVRETDRIFFDEALRSDVKAKGDSDFVTRADVGISEYLHRRLVEEYPDIGFMSEEEDAELDESRDYWILDPIDGTTNFMHGLPYCAVSLGLCSDGEVVAGVIYIPYTGELFYAVKGQGAYLNGERIFCSDNARLRDCVGFYEFNAYFKNKCDALMDYARKIYLSCQGLRCLGSVAVELAYIACGRADAFFGICVKPWDYAAGLILIKEAGGRLDRVDGELHISQLNVNIAAANSAVFDELLGLLNG
ncbi:MAG: inositol monophosphatase [Clostridia bacterium]|nr:inositol monophosphatase [Clostridia bacterium]